MDRELLDTLGFSFIIGAFVTLPVMYLIYGLTVRIIRTRHAEVFERLGRPNMRLFYGSNRELFEGLKRGGKFYGFLYSFEWLELEGFALRILLWILVVYVTLYVIAFIFVLVANIMNPKIVRVY